ncbi:MAG: hypothetical protein LBH28_08925 [Oscillospiraceae bacterium]|jgi:flagellin-like hook-associated protein FlgL|nr:hypothetical protein [Oscillospiraceae bacterium]
MRVTNSMLVNNLMSNLNNNLSKLDTFQNQLASGRKYAHISDDPIAVIFSQSARNKLARLSHYQRAIGSAEDWLAKVEYGVRDLQERVADAYIQVMNAATDVNNVYDKHNISMVIKELRNHYLDTLNATYGDRFIFAGYNTPGDTISGKITGPFKFENGVLTYNGYNLSALSTVDNINLASARVANLNNEISDAMNSLQKFYPWLAGYTVPASYDGALEIAGSNDIADQIAATIADISALDPENPNYNVDLAHLEEKLGILREDLASFDDRFADLREKWDKRAEALKELEALDGSIVNACAGDLVTTVDNINITYNAATGIIDGLLYDINGAATPIVEFDPISGLSTANRLEYKDFTDLLAKLQKDVLTFDIGPGVSMPVTFNGIDLVLYQTVADDGKPVMRNIFSLLDEVYEAASKGVPAEELGGYIKELQDAQNHLLAKTAEIGGRTRRLELMSARYDQDEINYTKMLSDAEDADEAEVIMYLKMAEAVYQASLSAGARIIQPTLMDFLR